MTSPQRSRPSAFLLTIAPDINSVFVAVTRRKYIPDRFSLPAKSALPPSVAVVCSAPVSSAMDGANADHAGALIGPAGEGHCNKYQIHVLRVNGTAMNVDSGYDEQR